VKSGAVTSPPRPGQCPVAGPGCQIQDRLLLDTSSARSERKPTPTLYHQQDHKHQQRVPYLSSSRPRSFKPTEAAGLSVVDKDSVVSRPASSSGLLPSVLPLVRITEAPATSNLGSHPPLDPKATPSIQYLIIEDHDLGILKGLDYLGGPSWCGRREPCSVFLAAPESRDWYALPAKNTVNGSGILGPILIGIQAASRGFLSFRIPDQLLASFLCLPAWSDCRCNLPTVASLLKPHALGSFLSRTTIPPRR